MVQVLDADGCELVRKFFRFLIATRRKGFDVSRSFQLFMLEEHGLTARGLSQRKAIKRKRLANNTVSGRRRVAPGG